MKLKLSLLLVVAALGFAAVSVAQGGGGQRRSGGYGGGQRRGGRNNTSLTALVFRADVQSDLALTDDEKSKLDALRESFRPQRPQGGGGTPPSREEMQARQAENEKKIQDVLTPDQFKRLQEIQIQLMGAQALRQKNVQEQLGLSTDQVSKLDAIFQKYQAASQSVREKMRNNEIDAATAQSDNQKNLAELKTETMNVLTADQQTKFQSLGGKPFTPAAPQQ